MIKYRKLALLLTSLSIMAAAAGCGEQSSAQENTAAETEAVTEASGLTDKSYTSLSGENVKKIGRTYLAPDGTLWLGHTDSGVEFMFTGTSASVTFTGDKNAPTEWGKDSYARYAVYVDGERVFDDLMTEAERTVELCSFDEEKETRVKILKISECANSTIGIKSLDVTGTGKIAPTEEKELKIEFIGDSITCGYGVDDEVKENHFSTATEDGTKTYAFKTAEALDADYSMVSFSGHGIVSGYTTQGKAVKEQCVPDYYAKAGRSYGASADFSMQDIDWDFTAFTPDIVVINLGTNDASYTGGSLELMREYTDGYIEFLGQVRENNPDAYILCTLGIMGNTLYPDMEAAVIEFTEDTGDEKVGTLLFDVQSAEDGYAADWHPTEATHAKAAEKLTEKVREIIGE
ncbi:MAG: GDSL-type esterase/lipase family protein [Ruminococcus sp.]|nr:GDSL-type esterase/lipase family protein [Ruminococcus sp.]